jgi:methanogenic corrinoid protein MtbC1
MAIQHELLTMIRQADRQGAGQLLDAWGESHGYERLLAEVIEPTLLLIGEDWLSAETFTLAQAYVAAKVAEDALLKIDARKKEGSARPATRGAVVIGNIEEDFHSLGRRMLGTFLASDGWAVHDLGNDVPAGDFVDTAEAVGARVIGVSAMMLTTAHNIRKVRDELERRGLARRIKLAVGGAVFLVRPGLDREVGGDGTARTALAATALFRRLWQESSKAETVP